MVCMPFGPDTATFGLPPRLKGKALDPFVGVEAQSQ